MICRAALLAILILCGCSREADKPRPVAKPKQPAPSPYDQNFWNHWTDGKAEYCAYTLDDGEANTILRVDEGRVMHLTVRRIRNGRSEMLEAAMPLEAAGERPAGAVSSASFSSQQERTHSWAQAAFGARRSVVTRHAPGQLDSTQVLDHAPPGVSVDGLMLWARRIAWPRVREGGRSDLDVINSLSSDGRLELVPGSFSRTRQTAAFVSKNLYKVIFEVHPALPHYIRGWQSSDGERATLVNCERR